MTGVRISPKLAVALTLMFLFFSGGAYKVYEMNRASNEDFMVVRTAAERIGFRLKEVSESTLQGRLFLLNNFDPLVSSMTAIKENKDVIEPRIQNSETIKKWEQFKSDLNEFTNDVEGFKTDMAVLRNSLLYLPDIMNRINTESLASSHRANANMHATSLWAINQFAGEKNIKIQALSGDSSLRELQLHSGVIQSKNEHINSRLANIRNPKVHASLQEFASVVHSNFTNKFENLTFVTIGFFGTTGLLLAVLLLAAIRLKNTNVILEDQVEERTKTISTQQQKLARSAKLSALGEMAAGVAHEINNPLTIIRGKVSFQLRSWQKDKFNGEKFERDMNLSIGTVDRIAKIIKGLRTFSRDAAQDELVVASIDSIIEDTLTLCQEKFTKNSVDLKIASPETLIFVSCQPTQLSQVLLNLLNNAFDAVGDGETKWVELSQALQGETVELRVTDSGPGIPPEIRQKILQPFFTTKAVGKGTGLGLSISTGIVEKLGGKFFLDEKRSHTSFVIQLPVAKTEAKRENSDQQNQEEELKAA